MKSISDILQNKGPLLTSEIAAFYRDQGLTNAAARQRVYRRSKEVKSLYGLPFPKNTKFLYLPNQFSTSIFYEALLKRLDETNSS